MAFLGIRIPHEVGRLIRNLDIPGVKETPSEYHITLLVFEDNWSIKRILKATEVVYDIVSEIDPFTIKADRISHFPPRPDHPIPIIAPIKSEGLHQLHKKLSKAFDKNKIDFKKTFKEYHPHITLAYSEDEYDDYRIDSPIEFVVNEVTLWGGDEGDTRLFTTFQLKAPDRKKHGALFNKIDIFEKLASL
jgi:2'-5' RNA ligase